jgi:tRNA A37 threonylcarbamoyladenosine biosynthesis protein TsaE
VQTYEGPDATLWHADLYRLSDPAEAMELGLDEAFARSIALIEWPDRLGPLRPARALTARLSFEPGREGRRLDLTGEGVGWDRVLAALEAAA